MTCACCFQSMDLTEWKQNCNFGWAIITEKLFVEKMSDCTGDKTRYGHCVTFQTSLAVAVHPASKGVGYFAGNRSLVTGKSPLRSLQASPPSGACIMYSTWLFIGHLGFEDYLRKSTQTAFEVAIIMYWLWPQWLNVVLAGDACPLISSRWDWFSLPPT